MAGGRRRPVRGDAVREGGFAREAARHLSTEQECRLHTSLSLPRSKAGAKQHEKSGTAKHEKSGTAKHKQSTSKAARQERHSKAAQQSSTPCALLHDWPPASEPAPTSRLTLYHADASRRRREQPAAHCRRSRSQPPQTPPHVRVQAWTRRASCYTCHAKCRRRSDSIDVNKTHHLKKKRPAACVSENGSKAASQPWRNSPSRPRLHKRSQDRPPRRPRPRPRHRRASPLPSPRLHKRSQDRPPHRARPRPRPVCTKGVRTGHLAVPHPHPRPVRTELLRLNTTRRTAASPR